MPVIVLSSHPMEIPDELTHTVSHSSESPTVLCERLSQEGAHRLYIDGGMTIQRFLAEGLINELTITVIPIILGKGIPLFSDIQQDISLRHITTKSYECGFVQLTYEVEKKCIKMAPRKPTASRHLVTYKHVIFDDRS